MHGGDVHSAPVSTEPDDLRRVQPARPAPDHPIADATRRGRSIEAAAIAGVVYGVLTLIALRLFDDAPRLTLDEARITAWYDDAGNRSSLLLGLNLAAISSIAFLWFVAVIRRRIGDREDRFFSTVFFGSAIAYVAIWLLAASMVAAPAVAVGLLDAAKVTPATAALANGQAAAVLLVVAPRLQAVFVFTTTTIILRTGVLPRWFAILGYVIGLTLLVVPVVARPLGVAFPVWVLAMSIALFIARPGSPVVADEPVAPDPG